MGRDQQPVPGGYRQLLLAELRGGLAQEVGGVDSRRSSCRTKCVRGPGFSFPASMPDPRILGRARADRCVLFVRVWGALLALARRETNPLSFFSAMAMAAQ